MFIYQAVQPPASIHYQLATAGRGANPSSEDASRWGAQRTAWKVAGLPNMSATIDPSTHEIHLFDPEVPARPYQASYRPALPFKKPPSPSVLGRQVTIQSLATESAIREIAHALGYRLQVQGNPSFVSLAGVLSRGTMTAKQALSAIGSLSTMDITVNEPERLLQVRILPAVAAVAVSDPATPIAANPSSSVSMTNAGVQPQEPATGGLPTALKRKVTLQRGDLQSVMRQIAAITGYQVRVHPSAPMGVIGDGLPWGKPVAVAVILHKLGKQSYLDVEVLPQARHINVTVNL